MSEIPLEAPPDDVAEQRAEVTPPVDGDDFTTSAARIPVDVPFDADPADVADQQAEVPLDDDWP